MIKKKNTVSSKIYKRINILVTIFILSALATACENVSNIDEDSHEEKTLISEDFNKTKSNLYDIEVIKDLENNTINNLQKVLEVFHYSDEYIIYFIKNLEDGKDFLDALYCYDVNTKENNKLLEMDNLNINNVVLDENQVYINYSTLKTDDGLGFYDKTVLSKINIENLDIVDIDKTEYSSDFFKNSLFTLENDLYYFKNNYNIKEEQSTTNNLYKVEDDKLVEVNNILNEYTNIYIKKSYSKDDKVFILAYREDTPLWIIVDKDFEVTEVERNSLFANIDDDIVQDGIITIGQKTNEDNSKTLKNYVFFTDLNKNTYIEKPTSYVQYIRPLYENKAILSDFNSNITLFDVVDDEIILTSLDKSFTLDNHRIIQIDKNKVLVYSLVNGDSYILEVVQ